MRVVSSRAVCGEPKDGRDGDRRGGGFRGGGSERRELELFPRAESGDIASGCGLGRRWMWIRAPMTSHRSEGVLGLWWFLFSDIWLSLRLEPQIRASPTE
jgi:hypothetical protein